MANKFARENMSKGGFNLDGIYTATGARFEEDTHKVTKDSDEQVTDVVCVLDLEDEGGNPMEFKLKLGSAEKFQVTKDGADYDGPAINDRSKFGVFLNSLEDAGFDMDKLEDGFGEGITGLRFEARPEEIPGKPGFNNGKGFSVTKVVRVLDEDEKPKKKTTAAKPVAGKKPVKKDDEAAEDGTERGVDEVEGMAQEVIMGVLEKVEATKAAPAKFTSLPRAVFAFITENKDRKDWAANKTAISKLSSNGAWLQDAEKGHPWTSNKTGLWLA